MDYVKLRQLYAATPQWARVSLTAIVIIVLGTASVSLTDNRPHPLLAGLLASISFTIFGVTIYLLTLSNRGTVGEKLNRDGLPDAQFITWESPDGESHIASQILVGDEALWRHDGATLTGPELLELCAGVPVSRL